MTPTTAKLVLYGASVACFCVAGVIDFAQGDYKLGTVAIMFGACNAVIFFWRA